MKILGIIPARGGSKGIPQKNIKLLRGKPLLEYTSEVALQSEYLSSVILSSDDEKIIQIGKQLGLEVPFVRPIELATDQATSLSVVEHALDFYANQNIYFDAVCLLQTTSPFRTVSFLDKAIEKFINSDVDSLISVLEVPHQYNPHWTFEVSSKDYLNIATGDEEIISRRQQLPKAFHRDGSIYITKTSVILERNSFYGTKVGYIVSSNDFHVNIDTDADWKLAEILAQKTEIN